MPDRNARAKQAKWNKDRREVSRLLLVKRQAQAQKMKVRESLDDWARGMTPVNRGTQ